MTIKTNHNLTTIGNSSYDSYQIGTPTTTILRTIAMTLMSVP